MYLFCWIIFFNNILLSDICTISLYHYERIGGVTLSVLASSVVDRGFESRSGQTNDYNIYRYLLLLQ